LATRIAPPARSLRSRILVAVVVLVGVVLLALVATIVLTSSYASPRDALAALGSRLLWLTLGSLLLGTAIAVLLSRQILRPLSQLTEGAAHFAEGRLEHRIDVGTGDELEVLARTFNHMAAHLDALVAALAAGNRALQQSNVELPTLEQPQGVPPVFEDHLALMFDLQLLAFQSDLTRVITFMIGKEQSARPYPQIGVPEAHHPLSHHNDVAEIIARLSQINRYHTELFSKQLAKLRATPDGDGSLLDHMTIMYGSGISNSTRHSGQNLPLMLIGGGAGRLDGGRHLKYTDKPSIANLLVTLMDKLDVPVEKIGGSTGKLPLDSLAGV